MGTTITYNDVTLENVTTRKWEQEIVYDSSNTDVLYHKFSLSFDGILHGQGTKQTSPAWIGRSNQGPSEYTALYKTVRGLLGQSRKKLTVVIGGKTVLEVSPADTDNNQDANRDVDNGPRPKQVTIAQVAGTKLFRVSFAIECAKIETRKSIDAYSGTVLSNRWTVEESMDDNWFTTRTIRGRMRIAAATTGIQFLRRVVVPGLEQGFRRDSFQYVVSANGLEADYTVTDRQVHTAAPWPATKIDGTYSEFNIDGVTYGAEVQVTLEGPPHADKQAMMARLIHVIDAKLQISRYDFEQNHMVEGASLIEHIGERNIVEGRYRIKHMYKNPKAQLFCVAHEKLGVPLELPVYQGHSYDPTISQTPNNYGYVPGRGERDAVVLALMNCYLQTPESDHHEIKYQQQAPPEYPDNSGQLDTKVSGGKIDGELPTDSVENHSESTHKAVYTMARAESRYLLDPCRVQMPLANEYTPGSMEDTCVILDLALSQAQREIVIDAERVGEQPEIPEPVDEYQDGAIKGTLLRHWVRPQPPTLAADGRQRIFRITAYYCYALNRPPTKYEAVRIGVLPFTKFTQAEVAFKPGQSYQARLAP